VVFFRYQGGPGMLAWAFHRISGLAIWVFILLHVFDIWLASVNPPLYDELLVIYGSAPGRVGEMLLGAALLYHALNGLRIIIIDLWPRMTVYHRVLWWGTWVIFIGVGVPGALTSRSPGRSPNSDPRSSAMVTPSEAATLDRTAGGASDARAASTKTSARARLGGTAAALRWPRRSRARTSTASLSFSGGLSHGSGSRSRASSSRWGRPMNRSCSSRRDRNHGWSCSPRK